LHEFAVDHGEAGALADFAQLVRGERGVLLPEKLFDRVVADGTASGGHGVLQLAVLGQILFEFSQRDAQELGDLLVPRHTDVELEVRLFTATFESLHLCY